MEFFVTKLEDTDHQEIPQLFLQEASWFTMLYLEVFLITGFYPGLIQLGTCLQAQQLAGAPALLTSSLLGLGGAWRKEINPGSIDFRKHKRDIKCQIILGCLDQYTHIGSRLKQLGP